MFGLRSFIPTSRRKGQLSLFGPVFLPLSAHESRCLLAFPLVALGGYRSGLPPFSWSNTPSADFRKVIEVNRFTLSHDSVTCRRSPEVSSTPFDAQPPDLPAVNFMDMSFAVLCPLARHRRPLIRFLFIGSHFAPCFPQTPPCRECYFTLALRHHFMSITL